MGRSGSHSCQFIGDHSSSSWGRQSTISQSWKKPRSVTEVAIRERTKLFAPSAPTTYRARTSAGPAPEVRSSTSSGPCSMPVTSQPRCTVTVGSCSAAPARTASSSGWEKKFAVGQPEGPVPDQSILTSGSRSAFCHS
ncbi:hypothetical protein GA0115252_14435 [Streptomyces sp. DfronAA-171]|nr:hypothetical protein GA0115252_14435 [Streptomyces sp. DfronAA-171]